jgi:hypothetical protein
MNDTNADKNSREELYIKCSGNVDDAPEEDNVVEIL